MSLGVVKLHYQRNTVIAFNPLFIIWTVSLVLSSLMVVAVLTCHYILLLTMIYWYTGMVHQIARDQMALNCDYRFLDVSVNNRHSSCSHSIQSYNWFVFFYAVATKWCFGASTQKQKLTSGQALRQCKMNTYGIVFWSCDPQFTNS